MQCGALDPTMDKLEKAYPNVKFYSANISDIGNIATRYGIICLPTVIIFKDGKVIHQLYGNLPQNVFEEELNKL
jgi:thioredoxin 1